MFMETPTAMMTIDTIPSHIQSEERGDYNNNADDTGSVGVDDYNDSADDTGNVDKDSADDTGNATDANDQKPIPEGDDNGSSEDVVPAGDKDSADGTGNADDATTAAKKTSLLMTMAVPTIQATQGNKF
jgi:hypothetical protein